MFRIISFLLIYFTITVQAQNITHGPVVGGVTDTSARFVMFANTPATLGVQLSLTNNFAVIVAQASNSTNSQNGNSTIVNISGLQPQTRYYYRPTINGGFVSGDVRSFKTFPAKAVTGNFTITFGSCMNENRTQDAVFAEMQNHNPDLFLQVGDWGYPDNTDDLPNNPDFYPVDYNRVVQAYRDKYDYTNMKEFLKNVPIDYTWDDHDYVDNNTSRLTASYTDFGIPIQILEIPFSVQTRRNIIKGYYDLFPGYAPVDSSEGIFHKFLFGNVEVYMLDDRAARDPVTDGLQNVNGNWQFNPPPGHSIIGDIQRQWLLDNLKKSTATWKLITTATAFNKTYRNVINPLLNLPQIAGLPLVSAIIDCWSGYPMDQDSIINLVNREGIDGLLMLSGDTHTSAMDDGQTGGLPEIMAGCLSQSNSTLFTTVPLLQFGLEWNKGGQGISTNNNNDAFGKLSVYGDDSLHMELIDENGTVFAQHTLYSCSFQTGLKLNAATTPVTCNGNQNGIITLNATGGAAPYRYSLTGDVYQSSNVFDSLAPGKYYPVVKDNNGCTKQLIVTILEYPILNVLTAFDSVSCYNGNDGRIGLFASGGLPPYNYIWSNGLTASTVQNLPSGNYTISVQDAANCIQTFSFNITQPDSIATSFVIANTTCSNSNDGNIKVVLSGGTAPLQFLWNNGSDTLTRNNLSKGNYAYTVTDANNCTKTGFAIVNGPADLQINATILPDSTGNNEGAIFAEATGGTAPYSYTWINGSNNDSLLNLGIGSYLLQVVDANGCRASKIFTVSGITYVVDESMIDIEVYPNPVQDILTIKTALQFIDDVSMYLIDMNGRICSTKQVKQLRQNSITIDTRNLSAGKYVLQVQGKKFKQTFAVLKK